MEPEHSEVTVGRAFSLIWKKGAKVFRRGDVEGAWKFVKDALSLLPLSTSTVDLSTVELEPRLSQAFARLPRENMTRAMSVAVVIEALTPVFYQPASLSVKPNDAEMIRVAFESTEYQDAGSVQELMRRLDLFSSAWSSELNVYAPYMPLINASMTGKSRLLAEVCRHQGVFGFLMCLRPDKSPEYRPPRTVFIADWATNEHKELVTFTHQTCVLLRACLYLLHRWLKKQCKLMQDETVLELARRWDEYMEKENESFWNKVHRAMQREAVPDVTAASPMQRANAIIDAWRDVLGTLKKKIDTKLVNLVGKEQASTAKILFIVDEARQLKLDHEMSGFAMFRRALRALPFNDKLAQIFCIVTDTTSRASNLAPPAEIDSSGRVAAEGRTLFPPFTVVNTVDVWWDAAKKKAVSRDADPKRTLYQLRNQLTKAELRNPEQDPEEGDQVVPLDEVLTLGLLETYELKAMFGRAGLYAHLMGKKDVPIDGQGPGILKRLLMTKLLCDTPQQRGQQRSAVDDTDAEDVLQMLNKVTERGIIGYTETQVIGVLGAVASIQVSASSRLATELSAGHMRLLAAISKLRKYVYTFEVSEPILAHAAHRLICRNLGWKTVISKLVVTQLNQSTQVGDRGEMGFQLLSLMAWQVCLDMGKKQRLSFPVVPVVDFLERLLGKKLADVSPSTAGAWSTMKTQLKNAYVDVSQFVSTQADPSVQMLFEYFIRGSAIVCKKNQMAIDSVVPIFFSEAPESIKFASHVSNADITASVQERVGGGRRESVPSGRGRVDTLDDINKEAAVRLEGMSSMSVQIKDRPGTMGASDKLSFLDKLDRLAFLNQNRHLPTIVLWLEFDSRSSGEMHVPEFNSANEVCGVEDPRSIRSLVARTQTIREGNIVHDRHVIFARRLKPSDILADEPSCDVGAVDEEFHRLIEGDFKIEENKNIHDMDRQQLKLMCKTQPIFSIGSL